MVILVDKTRDKSMSNLYSKFVVNFCDNVYITDSTIPKRGVIFVLKGYQILDLGPVYQDQEIISHQIDLELPTPIHPGILLRYLQDYDQEGTNYVVNGFTQGFSVLCLDFKTTLNCRNLP
jgi:hypothetical protein